MKVITVPVTGFAQNCRIIICQQTNKAALVDPGGDGFDDMGLDVLSLRMVKMTPLMRALIAAPSASGPSTAMPVKCMMSAVKLPTDAVIPVIIVFDSVIVLLNLCPLWPLLR